MVFKLLAVSFFLLSYTVAHHTETTLPVKKRVDFLKFQLQEQIRSKLQGRPHNHDKLLGDDENPKIINANYDYLDLSRIAITPISHQDRYRHKHDALKLRQLATTTTTTTTWQTSTTRRTTVSTVKTTITTTTPVPPPLNPLSDEAIRAANRQRLPSNHKKSKRKKKQDVARVPASASTEGPVDVFYRYYRRLTEERTRNMPIRWIHCQDMITPFLTGVSKEESPVPKVLGLNHRTVIRLLHLLSINTSTYAVDEIRSLLYQVDKIQIRLFQWDTAAMEQLFFTITGAKRYTFKGVKYGIRRLFRSWHMTVNNITNLLQESRLFRPACVNVIAFDGSTKSSKGTTYTTLDQETTTSSNCADDDEEEEERRSLAKHKEG